MVEKLASAIYNDVMAGLAGYSSTPTMSIAQLEDDVIDVMLNFCKKHLMSDEIYFMENGDIVAGWRTVGKFKLEKQFN